MIVDQRTHRRFLQERQERIAKEARLEKAKEKIDGVTTELTDQMEAMLSQQLGKPTKINDALKCLVSNLATQVVETEELRALQITMAQQMLSLQQQINAMRKNYDERLARI
jgi:hypothetical protein